MELNGELTDSMIEKLGADRDSGGEPIEALIPHLGAGESARGSKVGSLAGSRMNSVNYLADTKGKDSSGSGATHNPLLNAVSAAAKRMSGVYGGSSTSPSHVSMNSSAIDTEESELRRPFLSSKDKDMSMSNEF
jgi:hypothetical protein